MKIKKNIFRIFMMISLFLLALRPLCETMNAVGSIDVGRSDGSIALGYKWNDEYILHDTHVHIYKVGLIDSSGAVSLTSDFQGASIDGTFPEFAYNNDDIYNQQQQANALSLYQYAQSNGYEPLSSGLTDVAGEVCFSSLQVGVYLITADSISYDETYRYDFSPFFVCLPYRSNSDMWAYSMTAYPKCTRTEVSDTEVKYKIIKSWINDGNIPHPQEVKVQILKNNELFEEIMLSSAQNWVYEWTVQDDPNIIWSVKEINIPEKYAVSYSVLTSGVPADEPGTNPRSVFVITNKSVKEEVPDNPNHDNVEPNENIIDRIPTGDALSTAWLTALLSASGVIILLLGIRRKTHTDKNEADTSEKQ